MMGEVWGPGDGSWEVVIAINIPEEFLRPWFDRVETRVTVECDYCMPDRTRMPITVCRGLAVPIREFWPKVKCWTCDWPDFVRVPRVPGRRAAGALP